MKLCDCLPKFELGELALIATVLVSYILTPFLEPQSFELPGGALFIILGIVYLVMGLRGGEFLCRVSKLGTAIFFAIQIPLAALIVYLSHGSAALVVFPLSAYAANLSRRWMFTVCALIVAAFAIAIYFLGGWLSALQATIASFSGMVFVLAFSKIALNEQAARLQVEQLAAELSEANRKLREYSVQVEELATTKERNRLAREIHDGLGHYLTAINMQIEAARAVLDTDRARTLDALNKAQALTKDGLADVRRSVAALRVSPLDNRTLRDAIGRLAEECRTAGILMQVHVIGTPHPLAPQTELTLYRAAEEGLTNVRKHAHASRTDITLDYSHDKVVRLIVKDNGTGANETDGGFGLLGVRERAQLLGG